MGRTYLLHDNEKNRVKMQQLQPTKVHHKSNEKMQTIRYGNYMD